jgi:site-specific DNA-cytosine methylase
MEPLTFGELFAGIGGFSLGLERAGMVCKWQVEIDPYAPASKPKKRTACTYERLDNCKTFIHTLSMVNS